MTETGTAPETVQTVRLDWDLIDRRCTQLGATTPRERAELLGTSRPTMYRWRNGQTDISLRRAMVLAARIGLTLAEVVASGPRPTPPPPQPRPPAGPGDGRPPAGPKDGD